MSMKIYKATIEQFKSLWNYSNSSTYIYFLTGLENETVEFWTIELDSELIAELYIFWDSIDKDEANGINRAYLCAFRVQKEFSGQGYGSQLMKRVLERINEKDFNEVTIGIDNREYRKLKKMYEKFGFTKLLKSTCVDNQYLDKAGKPIKCDEEYQIFIKELKGNLI